MVLILDLDYLHQNSFHVSIKTWMLNLGRADCYGDLLCHRLVPSCGRVRFGKNKELCMSSMLITRTLSWLVFAQDPSPTAGTTTMPFVAAYARYGLASKCGSGSSDACAAGKFNGRGTRGAPVILLPMFGAQWSSARFGWQHGV